VIAPELRQPIPTGRGAVTRQRIVEAAAVAFAERGYNGVNLNDVVRDLGLTKGALYGHFPSKEALAAEIVKQYFDIRKPLVARALADHENRLDCVIHLVRGVGRALQYNRVVQAGSRLSAERNLIPAVLPEPFVGWIGDLTDILQEGQRLGHVNTQIDAKATAEMVVGFFYGTQTIAQHITQRRDLMQRLDHFWALVAPNLCP
jgi:AcrR family transcriptional regulator